jgi:hypothetical protein
MVPESEGDLQVLIGVHAVRVFEVSVAESTGVSEKSDDLFLSGK